MRSQREDQAQAIGHEQDHRDLGVELELRRIGNSARQPVEDRGHDQSDRAEEEHRRAEAGSRAIEALHRVAETADEGCSAEDEEHVADDRSGQRGLDEIGQPLTQGQDADDQLGGIAEGRVQQPADAATEMLGELLGGTPDEGGQGQDGEYRRSKDQCVPFGCQLVEEDGHRNESQQSQESAWSTFAHDDAVAFDMKLRVCENRSGASHSLASDSTIVNVRKCPISPLPSPYPIASS